VIFGPPCCDILARGLSVIRDLWKVLISFSLLKLLSVLKTVSGTV